MGRAVIVESWPVDAGARTPAQSKVFEQPEITLGRSWEADVVLDSARVSRLAIRLCITDDALVLVDDSEEGSFIDGVHGHGRRPLREGAEFRIGPYGLRVRDMPPGS
ncbi:hypothetical protein DRW03_16010 [Corallococcus sp. H22C18031201]|uniref:FHA domain-containing protein n=1 Tax=Citreicoccus inhibens TaxID=2849499 RepID=UPI000E75A990|nr:FHA domain-containing protein [Citreicoccus inhibens]MBU8899821.1 FHA domain-containing protein [Citreicoccus inhibens]RJS21841.1 hypothetical protein DRW03_16010 [Corallococcus sp. H22C18031201]